MLIFRSLVTAVCLARSHELRQAISIAARPHHGAQERPLDLLRGPSWPLLSKHTTYSITAASQGRVILLLSPPVNPNYSWDIRRSSLKMAVARYASGTSNHPLSVGVVCPRRHGPPSVADLLDRSVKYQPTVVPAAASCTAAGWRPRPPTPRRSHVVA